MRGWRKQRKKRKRKNREPKKLTGRDSVLINSEQNKHSREREKKREKGKKNPRFR
jgi:hypothetical protein